MAKVFAQRVRRLSAGMVTISCLTELDEKSINENLALALIYYRPLTGEDTMIRVRASWDKYPADMVTACNRSSLLNVNIGRNIAFHDGDSIEKNETFGQLLERDNGRPLHKKKIRDIGNFRRAFLFISYEGNFRGSSQSISSDDGEHLDFPGYDIGEDLVKILPEDGIVSHGWYRVDILNRFTSSVIIRVQALPAATVFQVLEKAQLAKQCSSLLKTASPYSYLEWTMNEAYEHGGKVENGTRVVGLLVETARSGPDLREADEHDSDEEEPDEEEPDEEEPDENH